MLFQATFLHLPNQRRISIKRKPNEALEAAMKSLRKGQIEFKNRSLPLEIYSILVFSAQHRKISPKKSRSGKEGKERFLVRKKCVEIYPRGSTNLNGKFWNFWPNFIHLKSFSVVCFHRIRFSFPYTHYIKALKWLHLKVFVFNVRAFLQAFRETLGITEQAREEKKHLPVKFNCVQVSRLYGKTFSSVLVLPCDFLSFLFYHCAKRKHKSDTYNPNRWLNSCTMGKVFLFRVPTTQKPLMTNQECFRKACNERKYRRVLTTDNAIIFIIF